MNRETKIRCRCSHCHNTQLVPVEHYLAGPVQCWRRSLNRPQCSGIVEYFSDDHQDTMLNALAVLQHLRKIWFHSERLGALVDTVADDFGTWMEGNVTPEEMGWVDSKGQP